MCEKKGRGTRQMRKETGRGFRSHSLFESNESTSYILYRSRSPTGHRTLSEPLWLCPTTREATRTLMPLKDVVAVRVQYLPSARSTSHYRPLSMCVWMCVCVSITCATRYAIIPGVGLFQRGLPHSSFVARLLRDECHMRERKTDDRQYDIDPTRRAAPLHQKVSSKEPSYRGKKLKK